MNEITTTTLPISAIDRTKTQTRVELNHGTVLEYAAIMSEQHDRTKAGETISPEDRFPAPVVFWQGEEYWLGDGFHRIAAAEMVALSLDEEEPQIECEVRPGGFKQALEYSLTANAKHGLQRTNADKRHAVGMALQAFPALSDRAIAEKCGVSPTTVGSVRAELRQVSNLDTSTAEPEMRTGQDGKQYPATQPPRAAAAEPEAEEDDESEDDDEPANIQQEELDDEEEESAPAPALRAQGAKIKQLKSGTEIVSTNLKKDILNKLGFLRRALGTVGLITSDLSKTKGDPEAEDALDLLIAKVEALVVEPDAEQRPATRHSRAA